MKMRANKYYAYFIPRSGEKGVLQSWQECEKMVSGESGARFKGFSARKEAVEWLEQGADWAFKKEAEPGVYFDAGTGRGRGVEVSVTNERGESLLFEVMPKKKINQFGTHRLGSEATNNYGELLACKYALQIAIKCVPAGGIKKVFGDSELVINYWSKGFIKKKELPQKTVRLAMSVAKLRGVFENQEGELTLVSGADNPADLGFHR